MTLSVITIPCLEDNYAFILRCSETSTTAVVDVPDAAPILAALKEREWGLDYILLTHHHFDHIDGVPDLQTATGAQVIGASADEHRLPPLDHAVKDGDIFEIGASSMDVIDVSGHTIGHIAFWFQDEHKVFSADSLMALGCGRIFEGTQPMMWETMQKFIAMPADTMVYSGHEYTASNAKFAWTIEPDNADLIQRAADIEKMRVAGEFTVPSSIGLEMATNPFLRAGMNVVKNAIGMHNAQDEAVFAELRTLKDNF